MMTLQDLIDELTELRPLSARHRIVRLQNGNINNFDVRSIHYEDGEVIIELDEEELDEEELDEEELDEEELDEEE